MSRVTNRRRLFENIASLLTLQGFTYALPLITLPYLVRVIGAENYGLIVFSQAMIQFLVIATDYGFNFTATRDIANNRENLSVVSRIFSSVLLIKTCLMVLSVLVVAFVVILVPRFREEWAVYMIACLFIVGQAIFPVWFYQGMERMKYITAVNVTSRLVGTLCIFVFVRQQSDYLLAAGFQAGGTLLAGILGLFLVTRVAPIKFVLPSGQNLVSTFRDGWRVFVSQMTYTLKSEGGVFLLGLFYGNLIVGYYAIADKMIKAAMKMTMPLSTAIYPRVNTLFEHSREAGLAFLRKTLMYGGAVFLTASGAIFLSADLLVWAATGEANPTISLLLRIMAFAPLISFLDNLYGFQMLLPLKMQRQFMNAAVCSAVFFLGSSLLLVPVFGAVGSAITFVVSQAASLVLYFVLARRAGIKLRGESA